MRISDWSADVCSSDLHHVGDVDSLLVQLHAPRLDLREVEDVADDRQQMAGAAADVLCIFTVLRISERPEQSLLHDLGEADNGIQRRAQLMAHVREEGRLGVVRPLGLVAGDAPRSDEHTSELQSLLRISYAFFCFKKKN